jgi:hypothetical protein
MHQKLAREGLVCVSVSVDAGKDRAEVLKFLQGQKGTFANYLLNEKPDLWQERWKVAAPPAVFVFDRQGRRAAKLSADDPEKAHPPAEVEKLVRRLLKEAP